MDTIPITTLFVVAIPFNIFLFIVPFFVWGCHEHPRPGLTAEGSRHSGNSRPVEWVQPQHYYTTSDSLLSNYFLDFFWRKVLTLVFNLIKSLSNILILSISLISVAEVCASLGLISCTIQVYKNHIKYARKNTATTGKP